MVVGGGAGGCSVAAKFTKKLGKGQVAIIEPAKVSMVPEREEGAGSIGIGRRRRHQSCVYYLVKCGVGTYRSRVLKMVDAVQVAALWQ